jgi:hypothetical protein
MKEQAQEREDIMNTSNRGFSALALANLALSDAGDESEAAAVLLLSMEERKSFDFQQLLKLNPKYRAHADVVMLGYGPHALWPSRWIGGIGQDCSIIERIAQEWNK